jgi:hypothetical protein
MKDHRPVCLQGSIRENEDSKMEAREQILKSIREAIPKRGPKNLISELADADLWSIFLQWRSGKSTRSVASWASESLKPQRSAESWATSLKRLRPKIVHLLIALPLASAPNTLPLPSQKAPSFSVRELEDSSDLERIDASIREYEEIVHRMIGDAKQTGQPHKDLAKHQQALASLHKVKLKIREHLLKNPPTENEITPEERSRWQSTIDRLLARTDANELLEATRRFMDGLEDLVQTLEVYEDGSYTIRPRNEAERISDWQLGICGGMGTNPFKD